jgi:hypothetical protein
MEEQKPPKKAPVVDAELTVGCRVRVRRDAEEAPGVVVEDYAAMIDIGERGHDWAPAHRWAIALDDGRLVFADTTDLTVDTASGSSDPPR